MELLWFLEQEAVFDAVLTKGVVNLHHEPVHFLHKPERPEALWRHLLAHVDVNALGKDPILVEPEEPLWLRLARAPAKGDPDQGLCAQVRHWAKPRHPEVLERLEREEYFDELEQAGRRGSSLRPSADMSADMHTALTARADWRTVCHPEEPDQSAVWFAVATNACVLHVLPENETSLWATQAKNGQDLWFALAQNESVSSEESAVLARHLAPQPDAEGNGWWCALRPNWLDHLSLPTGDTFVRDHARLIIQGTPVAQKALADHLWSGLWPWDKDKPNQRMADLCTGLVEQGMPTLHPQLQAFLAAWAVGSQHPAAPEWHALMQGQGALDLPAPGKAWDNETEVPPSSPWHPSHAWHDRVASAFRSWNTPSLDPVQPRARRRLRS